MGVANSLYCQDNAGYRKELGGKAEEILQGIDILSQLALDDVVGLVPENIKDGVTILGVLGTYTGA